MENLYHYTNQGRIQGIYESGFLFPSSRALPSDQKVVDNVSARVKELIGDNVYLVGLELFNDPRWKEYGLMETLLGHVDGRGGIICFEVPIFPGTKGLVREHAYISSKGFIERYGADLFKLAREEKIAGDDQRFYDCWNLYINSTIPLSEYRGDFKVPEIWIAQKTPLDLLKEIPLD